MRARLSPLLLLPLLVPAFAASCGADKDDGGSEGEAACMTLFTALCEAEAAGTCGVADSGFPADDPASCVEEARRFLPEIPGLNTEAADACAALIRAPECDSPDWRAGIDECYLKTFACLDFPDSGWFFPDSGWSWDSGWGWDSGGGDGGGDGGGGAVDSCDWPDIGICFEFDGYDDTEAWCADIGSAYGFATTYSSAGCPLTDGECALPAGGDFPVPVTAYFYDYSAAEAISACESSGGTWNG
jgi:hypothetical protein